MRLAVRCFAACVLLSAAYAADNLPSAVFDSQRCRSGSCKGAGSRRYHVLDYMKHVFLSIGLVKFFRILPQKFFFVFVLIHKFCSWFLEIFGHMQPGHAGAHRHMTMCGGAVKPRCAAACAIPAALPIATRASRSRQHPSGARSAARIAEMAPRCSGAHIFMILARRDRRATALLCLTTDPP